jgi:hypothetical protein
MITYNNIKEHFLEVDLKMGNKYKMLVIGALALVLFFTLTVSARTWSTDDDGSSDFIEIQAATTNASSAADTKEDYDGLWIGNTSYNGDVWFNVSDNIVKTFGISAKNISIDFIDTVSWRRVGIESQNLNITARTFNATIINNQFNYTIASGWNVSGVFNSTKNANGTLIIQTEIREFFSENYISVYPPILWTATKVSPSLGSAP